MVTRKEKAFGVKVQPRHGKSAPSRYYKHVKAPEGSSLDVLGVARGEYKPSFFLRVKALLGTVPGWVWFVALLVLMFLVGVL